MTNDPLKELIENAVQVDGLVPSAVYLAAENGSVVYKGAFGTPDAASADAASLETIYDLASLTKPLVTGFLTALFIERRELSLEDPVASYVPEFAKSAHGSLTIRHLAAHISGLPPWIPFYLNNGSGSPKENVLSQIVAAEPLAELEAEVIYSDLNFILLGFILEKISGLELDSAASSFIFEPLGLTNTFFNPPNELSAVVAASETGNLYEKNMCRELYPKREVPDSIFRDYPIRGEVHDGNCFFMGGVAGHAGIFSNAHETFRMASQFVSATSELLAPETCRLFRENLTPRLNQARSLSFQLAETPGSSAGPDLPPDSFGHLGFTGTSLWIDPRNRRIYILLTNRSHNRKPPFPDLAVLRKNFNSAAHRMLENRTF